MQRSCAACGRSYDAKRASSKFCGDTCRMRAHRGVEAPAVGASSGSDSPTVAAVRAELARAERLDTWRGALALTLAERVDATPGSGAATLSTALQAAMDKALEGVDVAADDVDDLKARRDRKLAAG